MRRALLAGAALLLLGLVAAGIFAGLRYRQGQDVRGSSTEEFTATEVAPPPPEPGVFWPAYGFDPERHQSANYPHRPPYKVRWFFRARTLVEFPPVIGYGRLYFTNNYGRLYAVNAKTGKRAWKKDSGRCVASSPAVWEHLVIQTYLASHPCNRGDQKGLRGLVVARFAGFGQFLWQARIAPSESSPVVVDRVVYLGDWSGRVYALYARTGKLKWSFKTKGKIKGGVTVSGDRVYVGSYDHHLYALNRETGKLLWRAAAQQRLGKRGQFYSTPAAAYGRVYIGGTDGKVYSFGATTGKLRWSHSTGGYVYSSPAIWRGLVLIGSYSGRFYAFDAATGQVRWRFRANGRISGSPTVVNGIVYFSTLKERTYGLDARTGKRVWQFADGKYTPVVADPDRVYLTGYHRVYALDER